jgi:predicted DNA-binding transcriptional regulator AlpA
MPKTTTLTPAADAAGSITRAGKKPSARRPVPALAPELAEVALIDAPRIAAAACLSVSTWYTLVARGDAPQPVMRSVRCTRWRLSDIRTWLTERAERGCDPQAARTVVMKARNASKAAHAGRQVRRAGA